MRVTVIGAGAADAAAAVELTRRGHQIMLWGRSARTVEPFQEAGGSEKSCRANGRTAEAMVVAGLDREGLILLVRP